MKKKMSLLICLLLGLSIYVYSGNYVTNTKLGYTIYLPDNWICESKDSTQDYFYDTTDEYGALLSLIRYPIISADYDLPEEWTISHFIAYTMYMEYYPFGTMLFSDSSITEKQGDFRATEIYLRFYTDDTAGYSWDEYVRYSAREGYGYEMYAIGDTSDMMTNIGIYGAILKTINISPEISSIKNSFTQEYENLQKTNVKYAIPSDISNYLYDPLGRRTSVPSLKKRGLSNGIYIYNNRIKIAVTPDYK